jgi:hypothetical protein
MDTNAFITLGILITFIGAIIVLLLLSYLVYDVAFIKQNPLLFIGETFVICVVSSATFFIMIKTRNTDVVRTAQLAGLLSIKFAVLHTLLQTSGYYSHLLS